MGHKTDLRVRRARFREAADGGARAGPLWAAGDPPLDQGPQRRLTLTGGGGRRSICSLAAATANHVYT
ncbi:unnamed protein product, partial [Iphiclides podalirius]